MAVAQTGSNTISAPRFGYIESNNIQQEVLDHYVSLYAIRTSSRMSILYGDRVGKECSRRSVQHVGE